MVKLSLSFANFVFKSELDENYISILSGKASKVLTRQNVSALTNYSLKFYSATVTWVHCRKRWPEVTELQEKCVTAV